MTKKVKIALLGAGILLSGAGAYMTSGKYGVQDNNMVLANVEALTGSEGDGDGGDGQGGSGNGSFVHCYKGGVSWSLSKGQHCPENAWTDGEKEEYETGKSKIYIDKTRPECDKSDQVYVTQMCLTRGWCYSK